ncbi:hypothetical protein ACFIOY_20425 [Bradyrhizobium sp. TZ2]
MLEHDYALLGGLNRAKVGGYLSLVAASVSAGIIFVLLAAVNLVQRLGLPANLTPSVLSLVGAGAVFGVLYWIFNRYAKSGELELQSHGGTDGQPSEHHSAERSLPRSGGNRQVIGGGCGGSRSCVLLGVDPLRLKDAIENCLPAQKCLNEDTSGIRALLAFFEPRKGSGIGWIDGLAIHTDVR